MIKEIQIYPRDEVEVALNSISFNFPVYKDGQGVQELLWDKGSTVGLKYDGMVTTVGDNKYGQCKLLHTNKNTPSMWRRSRCLNENSQ